MRRLIRFVLDVLESTGADLNRRRRPRSELEIDLVVTASENERLAAEVERLEAELARRTTDLCVTCRRRPRRAGWPYCRTCGGLPPL